MKTYKITLDTEGDESFIETENDGFNALELLGLLEWKQRDILTQLSGDVKPEIVKRKVVE